MKQFPSSLKYKKNHKPNKSRFVLNETRNFFPLFGGFGIKSVESGLLLFSQIEACRKSIRRSLRKQGNLVVRVFTYFSWTKKPIASRMGKGKGTHSQWVCPVRVGQIICEISGIREYGAKQALNSAKRKLPMKTVVVKNIF